MGRQQNEQRRQLTELKDIIANFEHELRRGEHANIISRLHDKMRDVEQALAPILPERAIPNLVLQRNLAWRGGMVNFSGTYEERDEIQERRYSAEERLLDARHPRRVAKVFTEIKPLLQARFGRDFTDRDDYVAMQLFYDQRADLRESFEELKHIERDIARLTDAHVAEPARPWQTVRRVWERERLEPLLRTLTREVYGLHIDLLDWRAIMKKTPPDVNEGQFFEETDDNGEVVRQELSGATLLQNFPQAASADKVGFGDRKTHPLGRTYVLRLSRQIMAIADGTFSFDEALNQFSRMREYDPYNIDEFNIPDEIKTPARQLLVDAYAARTDDAKRFITPLAQQILARWKATARDYQLQVDTHQLSQSDRTSLERVLFLKHGSVSDASRALVYEGRLPAILDMLVCDGYIAPELIDPPLPATLHRVKFGSLPVTEQQARLAMLPRVEPTLLGASASQPGFVANNTLAHRPPMSLERLAQSIGEEVLYRGRNLTILGSVSEYPSGIKYYSGFTLVNPAPAGMPGAVSVDGKPSVVRKLNLNEMEEVLGNNMRSNRSDLLPADSISVIAAADPKNFRNEQYVDTLAHAILFTPFTKKSELDATAQAIARYADKDVVLDLGGTGRMNFRTEAYAGGMIFSLIATRPSARETMFALTFLLTDYLKRNGTPYYFEQQIGEAARHSRHDKLRGRAFAEQHLDGIVKSLQGTGILRPISAGLFGDEHTAQYVDVARYPCQECGKQYIGGGVEKKGNSRQSIVLKDLHALRDHPHTFRDEYRALEHIKQLLDETHGVEPAFLAVPQILTPFARFAKSERTAGHRDYELSVFWERHGEIRFQYEEEEIEDHPVLQRLQAEENRLRQRFDRAARVRDARLQRLSETFSSNGGTYPERFMHQGGLQYFWQQQIALGQAYSLYCPTALPKNTDVRTNGELARIAVY